MPIAASEEAKAGTPTPAALMQITHDLAIEMHPHKEGTLDVSMDSSFERDIGLDSLGRVELLERIESAYDVRLPESVLANVESPRDVWRAIQGAGAARAVAAVPASGRVEGPERAAALPLGASTLIEVLDWHVLTHPDRQHVVFLDENGSENTIGYADLRNRAREVARGLGQRGIAPGETVAIMLPTGLDFFYAFFGILIAGAVPVPIYPPARPSQIEDHLRRQAGILANARVRVLITVDEAKPLAIFLKAKVKQLDYVESVADIREAVPPDVAWPVINAGDLAFIQYTSGSTGNPKGVVLTHANLLANVRAMGQALEAVSTDVFVSWLPLYHDMGLIGAWMGSLYHAVKLVVMSPLTFLSRPERWLWAIHHYRGTLSAAPNFAFELCQKRIKDADIEGLDLSSWRVAANGAEPVIPSTICTFSQHFAKYGFRPEAISPVYGLAEASVGLAFPPVGRGPLIDRIRRNTFATSREAIPAAADDDNVLEFPACGQPLPGHEIRVVDNTGRELPERREGRLQFRGPSCTSGYLRNPEATKELFDGDWLDSANYAYLHGGDIFLTGRAKDIIIKAGRNIYPQEIERAVGELDGVRAGCVAVFGSNDPRSGTERLVIMAETRETNSTAQADIRRRVEQAATDILGLPPDDVALVPPQAVLKTSSGKVRRDASRIAYETGAVSPRRRAVWLQVARLGVSTAVPELRRLLRRAGDYAFAGWWWTVLSMVTAVVWVGVTAIPSRRFGQGLVRVGSRLTLRLVTTPPRVEGLANLPAGPKVIVATHASYMDAMVLFAALPGDLTFAAKGELGGNWRTGPFINHIGSLFVERFETQRSVEDTGRLLDALRVGHTLVIFPEGTFGRMPGLLPFRMGAFTVAAEAGVPVIPVALRGTRNTLRSESWFPRRIPLRVTVCPPLEPEGTDWSAAIALRDRTRKSLLDVCGEPDLVFETGVMALSN